MSVLDLVSSNSASIGGNDSSFLEAAASDIEQAPQAISGDGRYVVFSSRAKNLTPQGANPTSLTQANEFVKDMVTGQVTELGQFTGAGGVLTDPNAGADYGAISDNGLFAVFLSTATNVAPPDPGLPFHTDDLFLENLTTHVITRVGPPTGVDIISTGVSNDGNTVLFTSIVNNTRSIFTKNVATGVITQIDAITAPDGTVITAPDANQSLSATLSADGRYVAFTSTATNLAGACVTIGNGAPHLFVKDLSDNSLRYFALDPIYHEASNVSISADGRFAVYEAFILFDANNGAAGIYRVDLQSGAVAVVSDAQGGTPPNGRSAVASISGDGRFVAFLTNATNLGPSDTNGVYDAYVKDMATGAVARISPDALPGNATLATISTSISSDGKYVVFTTASHLLANDGATNYDVFRVANPLAPPPTAPAGFYLPPGATDFIPAAAGSYIPFAGATSADAAILADPGFYVPTTGASAQTITPAGTFTNSLGAITPIQAPPGSYVPNEGATFATTTPPGTFTNVSGSVAPIPAPAGTYVQFAGQAAPTVTPAGSYTDVAGLSAPIPAPAGSYVPAEGATHATLAQPGFFVNTVGATAETAALPGSYVPGSGATSAITADPGYYVPTAHASAQIAAPPGTYVEFAGQAAPTITPAGTYTDTPGSVAPIPDPPGTFSAAGATAPTAFAPVLTLDSGASGADGITNAGGLTLSPPGTGASWQYSTDNGAQWSAGFTAVEGVNSVEVRHVDAQGHTSLASAPLIFTLDTIAQIGLAPASVSALSNNIYTTNSGVMNVFGLEPGSTWTYSVNNGSFVSATAPFVSGTGSSFTITGDGTKTVFVDQTDLAGNTVAGYIVVTLDTTAAAPVIVGPVNGSTVTTATPTISGTGEAGATVTVLIDGTAAGTALVAGSGAWNFTPSAPLSNAAHAVTATEQDIAGNVSTLSAADTFTVNTVPVNPNEAPTITSDGGAAVANLSIAENSTAVTIVHATDPDVGQTLTYTIENAPDSPDAALFTIDPNTGALSFVAAPDFEHPTDTNSDGIYGVIVKASDGQGGSSTQIIRVTVTNVNEPGTGGVTMASAVENANNTVTLTSANTITDPDGIIGSIRYQWQSFTSSSSAWTNITGATAAAFTTTAAQAGQSLRVTASYTDPFGVTMLISAETALVDRSGGNTLTGTAGRDFILGLAGNDTIIGFAGADVVNGGAGTDMIKLTATSADMNTATDAQIVNVEIISATGATAGVTIDLHNQTEGFTINGSSFGDTIQGSHGADVINTRGRADTIIGFVGADTVNGGGGFDTIVLSATSNDLNQAGNLQINNVQAVSAAVAATGVTIDLHNQTEGFAITGSAFADVLTGGNGGNTFVGFLGADTVIGGAGHDTIQLTSTSADLNSASDTQIRNIEAVSATGASAGVTIDLHNQSEGFTITGSAFADTIRGGQGADVINGGAADDTIVGFVGADTVNGGGGFDTIVLSATSANLNSASNNQIVGVEAVSAASAAAGVIIDLHNQTEAFVFTGSSFADTLVGGAGNDTISAGAGNDTLTGSGGADTFVFKADFGKDKITDFHVAATAGNPHDFVQLDHNQFSQFATVDALLASNQVTFANSGHDVVITLTNGQNSVTLQNANVTLATLQAHSSDFAFI